MGQGMEAQPNPGVDWAMFELCFVIVGAYAWIKNDILTHERTGAWIEMT